MILAMESPDRNSESRLNEKTAQEWAGTSAVAEDVLVEGYVRGPFPWNLKEPCARLPLVAVIWLLLQMAEPVR